MAFTILSDAPAEAPTLGGDGLLPLSEKHVVIRNKSSEDDFGLKHIPWNDAWASRDDSPVGELPICKECIWEVGQDDVTPICRISREKKNNPYCFEWEDGA
ncbi:unnamed protein product [Arabidopsis thaliana]|uniref:Uncharacterized protein n=1 Tax=Arabidopsis thaliana TaxID=3702 RepID=A0A5S9XKZ6_ARATH|nr:unnamed protein product [Arabidopsis thaliana]